MHRLIPPNDTSESSAAERLTATTGRCLCELIEGLLIMKHLTSSADQLTRADVKLQVLTPETGALTSGLVVTVIPLQTRLMDLPKKGNLKSWSSGLDGSLKQDDVCILTFSEAN